MDGCNLNSLDGIPEWYFEAALLLADNLSVAIWLAESVIFLAPIWKPPLVT